MLERGFLRLAKILDYCSGGADRLIAVSDAEAFKGGGAEMRKQTFGRLKLVKIPCRPLCYHRACQGFDLGCEFPELALKELTSRLRKQALRRCKAQHLIEQAFLADRLNVKMSG